MNTGKRFENDIKKSIPNEVFYYRIQDSTGNFSGGDQLRFTNQQPCDCFLFDCKNKILYTLELKSTESTSFSFESIDKPITYQKKIHKHQILSLKEFFLYENVCSGFLFNFRKKDGTQKTYFQRIDYFLKMIQEINKKSFNEKDLLKYNPIEIAGKKIIKNYQWNIENFLIEAKKMD